MLPAHRVPKRRLRMPVLPPGPRPRARRQGLLNGSSGAPGASLALLRPRSNHGRAAAGDRAGRSGLALSLKFGDHDEEAALFDAGKSRSKAGEEVATELAVAALSFLATEPERLERFLALTGLGPQSLARRRVSRVSCSECWSMWRATRPCCWHLSMKADSIGRTWGAPLKR